jgi:hypothetical protein
VLPRGGDGRPDARERVVEVADRSRIGLALSGCRSSIDSPASPASAASRTVSPMPSGVSA